MTFQKAVESTPGLSAAFREGLRALRHPDRNKITCKDATTLAGSVAIDEALAADHANEPRWDYAIGVRGESNRDRVIWVEVHPASSSNVKEMLAKLDWLTRWLDRTATRLGRLDRRVVWVASGAVAIQQGSPQARKLAEAGLRLPKHHLDLDRVWAD